MRKVKDKDNLLLLWDTYLQDWTFNQYAINSEEIIYSPKN